MNIPPRSAFSPEDYKKKISDPQKDRSIWRCPSLDASGLERILLTPFFGFGIEALDFGKGFPGAGGSLLNLLVQAGQTLGMAGKLPDPLLHFGLAKRMQPKIKAGFRKFHHDFHIVDAGLMTKVERHQSAPENAGLLLVQNQGRRFANKKTSARLLKEDTHTIQNCPFPFYGCQSEVSMRNAMNFSAACMTAKSRDDGRLEVSQNGVDAPQSMVRALFLWSALAERHRGGPGP